MSFTEFGAFFFKIFYLCNKTNTRPWKYLVEHKAVKD